MISFKVEVVEIEYASWIPVLGNLENAITMELYFRRKTSVQSLRTGRVLAREHVPTPLCEVKYIEQISSPLIRHHELNNYFSLAISAYIPWLRRSNSRREI